MARRNLFYFEPGQGMSRNANPALPATKQPIDILPGEGNININTHFGISIITWLFDHSTSSLWLAAYNAVIVS